MHVVVVGGGPVGLFAAAAAARSGLDVTVVESRTGDRDKACGEGLMPAAVSALEALDVRPDGVPFRGIRYVDASGRHQVLAALRDGVGLGVRRTELVRALRAATADAGVARVVARVVDVSQSRHAAAVHCQDGRSVEGDVVMGCDGLASTVRRAVGLDRSARGPRRYGLVGHFARAPWSDDVEVHWARTGEAYVTPVGPRTVGVALLGGSGTSFGERLRAFPALTVRLSGAAPIGRVLGSGPLRRRAAAPSSGRVLLVGDAAGYVDALTGEGLAIGFASANAAVDAALVGELDGYAGEWRRITRRFRWSTEVLVAATRPDGVRRRLVGTAAAAPGVYRAAVRLAT